MDAYFDWLERQHPVFHLPLGLLFLATCFLAYVAAVWGMIFLTVWAVFLVGQWTPVIWEFLSANKDPLQTLAIVVTAITSVAALSTRSHQTPESKTL